MGAKTLSQILAQNNAKLAAQQAAAQNLKSSAAPNPVPYVRGNVPPATATDSEAGYDSPFDGLAPGATRPMPTIPVQSVAIPVNTALTSSGQGNTNAFNLVSGGVVNAPVAPASAAGFAAIANMQVALPVTGPVQVSATLPVQSSSSNDTIQLKVFRDGIQIFGPFSHTLGLSNTANLVTVNVLDQPVNGNHVYALYWKAGAGTLSTTGTQRIMSVLNLHPQ